MPGLTVVFPSREIYFSPEGLNIMRLTPDTCPKTLDQWYELFHPEDHTATAKLEHAIYSSHEPFVSVVRRLYCGDGHYRNFRLDAFIQRGQDNRPVKLMGSETLPLGAWLAGAEDGAMISCGDRVLEAVRVQGVMTLKDVGEIEDMKRENMTLRREIQRRIFGASFVMPSPEEDTTPLRNTIEENITLALNVLTGNSQLKALRRSLGESCLTVGVAGLTGSGKTSFMNALLGERLIPDTSRAVIICREGEYRSAKVYYQDGRIEECRNLTASYLKDTANSAGAARIDIVMPGALIPEGLCFVDSPGFDALAGSNSAALRNILPELDIIAYVTPVRSRLKGSDYDYLRMILALSTNITFILSQTDLERDDTEAGKVIHSVRGKIGANIQALREDMKNFAGLDVNVVPVSAKKALNRFYDRKNQEWTDSNIEGAVNYFAQFSRDAYTRALVCRAARVSDILEGAVARREVSGSSRWRVGNITDSLKKCTDYALPEIQPYVYGETAEPEGRRENLLSSVMESMRESGFRTKFFSLETFRNTRKAVLLGADRSQSMKLFARLAHNIALEVLPEEGVNAGDWLCSGEPVPSGCVIVPPVGKEENILIAPSDADTANNVDWRNMFSEYVPVVSVDIARVDSGLYDLAHSPYISRLAFTEWILAFGNAGLFDTRQIDLVSYVPKRVKEFVKVNGLKSPEWFIYENYKIF